MFRPLLAGLLAAGLILAAGFAGSNAQEKKDEKKEPPKKKERIAIAEPKDVAKDPDFAIQGEYVGDTGTGGKVGVQVIAKGAGTFAVKAYKGGLPGDGWDKDIKEVLTGAAETKDGKVVATMKFGAETSTATIADGVFTVSLGDKKIELKKIERTAKSLGEKPPEGAVVLFGKPGDEMNWTGGKLKELSDGKYLDVGVKSKAKFGAFKVHVEFRLPWMPNSGGQGRGNSGVYLQDRYELQVLDSFGLSGENNECGGFYQAHKPTVNMCLPPMVWQTYDIEFTPAAFDADGKKTKNARASVIHNGVKIHDNVEFKGEGGGGQKENAMPGPFQFQNHGDPVVYRNVWVVEVK